MSCKPITFCNVSLNTFKYMKKKLQDTDIHIPPGNKGELSWAGIVADFEWDGKSESYHQNHEKTPFHQL